MSGPVGIVDAHSANDAKGGLQEQLTFLPAGTGFFQDQPHNALHNGGNPAGLLRAYRDTAHAGNAGSLVHLFGIVQVNGTYRTFPGTNAATGAAAGGFGNGTCTTGFAVRPVAGQGGGGVAAVLQLLGNAVPEFRKTSRVVLAR